jgi:DNA-binding response OmpR family regulator
MDDAAPFVLFGTPGLEWSELLQHQLRKQGIEVFNCTAVQELLEVARRRSPRMIVLDDGLESVGGQVLVRLIRDVCPDVPIALLLPPGSKPDREEQRHLGPICSLVLPVAAQEFGVVIASALGNREPSKPASPPVIFCVDDDAPFLRSLVRILRRRGYSVIGYDNPEKVLEGIPIHNPAMVFIDVLMPGMSGLDLASELREEYGDTLPIVLLSAKSSDQEISDGYRTGARYYITKPCEPDRVLNIADYLVGNLGPGERELLESKL